MTHDGDDIRDTKHKVLDLEDGGAGAPAAGPAGKGGAPDLATLMRAGEKWGYVDEDGGIHVRAGRYTEDRIVARVPPSKRAETLANLLLRFPELEDRFAELRAELRRSKNLARNLKTLQSFVRWVEGAEAIGDYDGLLGRAHTEITRIESRLAEGRETKIALVERAEALAESSRWASTGEVMNELMQEWKCAGSADRDQDEALWKRFSDARRTFFARRKEHFAGLKKSRAVVIDAKEALINRARKLAPSTDYEGTFADMQALLEEWKQAGSVSRDIDDRLWDSFRAAREPFFARRRTHIAEQRRRKSGNQQSGDRGPGGRDGPRDEGRGAPRGRERGGQNRRGERGVGGPSSARPRGADRGVLRSSLADIVGDLRDMFPAERDPENTSAGTSKGKGQHSAEKKTGDG